MTAVIVEALSLGLAALHLHAFLAWRGRIRLQLKNKWWMDLNLEFEAR